MHALLCQIQPKKKLAGFSCKAKVKRAKKFEKVREIPCKMNRFCIRIALDQSPRGAARKRSYKIAPGLSLGGTS